MTVRTTTLGGTDWADGETLYSADLNDTIESVGAATNDYTATKWNLIETLSPSGATTITSTGTLTVYDEYMVQVKLTIPSCTGVDNFSVRFNGDTGTNYYVISYASGGSAAHLFLAGVVNTTHQVYGYVHILGKTAPVASGTLPVRTNMMGNAAYAYLGGQWSGGNAVQITSMTFLRNDVNMTFSGKIKIYGRNI